MSPAESSSRTTPLMPTLTHKHHHTAKAQPLRVCAFIVITALTLLLGACARMSDAERKVSQAEIVYQHDKGKAIKLGCQISDSALSKARLSLKRQPSRIANIYIFKAIDELSNDNLKQCSAYIKNALNLYNSFHYKNEWIFPALSENEDKHIKQSIVNYQQALSEVSIIEWGRHLMPSFNEEQRAFLLEKDDSIKRHCIHLLKESVIIEKPNNDNDSLSAFETGIIEHGAYVIITCFLILATVVVFLFQRKNDAHKASKDKSSRQITELQTAIEGINSSIHEREKEIERLQQKLAKVKQTRNETLGNGRLVYQRIIENSSSTSINTDEEKDLAAYYEFAFPDNFSRLSSQFSSITQRHLTYLILMEMGLDDERIKEILAVKDHHTQL